VQAEALTRFLDLEARTYREAGERFEVTPERFKSLNGTKYGRLVRERRARKPKEE